LIADPLQVIADLLQVIGRYPLRSIRKPASCIAFPFRSTVEQARRVPGRSRRSCLSWSHRTSQSLSTRSVSGHLVPRSPHDVSVAARPRGIPSRACPRCPEIAVVPLTGFDSPSETLQGTALGCSSVANHLQTGTRAPPMRFSTRPATKSQRLGMLLRFHPQRQPPTAFLRPSRDSLINSCDLVSCRSHSSGFDPSRRFPHRELYPARHQAIPSRRFSASFRRDPERSRFPPPAAPPGLCVHGESVTASGVLHPSSARCPPGLVRSHGFRHLGIGSTSQHFIRP
jgi:hypothetical protein